MRPVPWWALIPSGCAPILLVGGWTLAAMLQKPGYDPATQTISILAGDGASDRWLMTGVLFALGACYALTALALRAAWLPGRLVLASGGVASVLLALAPVPRSGPSFRHSAIAAVGFTALAVWPCLAAHYRRERPWGLRPAPSIAVTVLLILGSAWFLTEYQFHGPVGIAERVLTWVESFWPFVVVVSCLHHASRTEPPVEAPEEATYTHEPTRQDGSS